MKAATKKGSDISLDDPIILSVLEVIKEPVIRKRPSGFCSLIDIVIGQQVSVPSATAIKERLYAAHSPLTPESLLACTEDDLRALGLSGPKIRYMRNCAADIFEERLDLDSLCDLSDLEADRTLQKVKGIGPWTAAVYLLFCDDREDIWPYKDVALLAAYRHAADMPDLTMGEFDRLAQDWAPHRGYAAHCLWTYYAHLKGRPPV